MGTIAGSKEEQIKKTFETSKLQYRLYEATPEKHWERVAGKNITGWIDITDLCDFYLRFPLVVA